MSGFVGAVVALQLNSRVCLPEVVVPNNTCEEADELVKQIYDDTLSSVEQIGGFSHFKIWGQICACDTDLCKIEENNAGQPDVNPVDDGEVSATTLIPG